MKLDFNYDGKTKLKDWWGKVKANFQTVQDGFNNLDSKVDEEIADRQSADTQLQQNIDAEISNRESADAQLKEEIESEKEQRQTNDDYLLEILNDRVPLIIADTLPDVVISLVGVMGANSYSLGSIGVKRGDVNEYYILSKINTVPGPKTTYKLTWEKISTAAEINTLNEVIEKHSLQLGKKPEKLSDYVEDTTGSTDNPPTADFPHVVGTKLYIVNDLGYDVTELRAGGDPVWKFNTSLIDGKIYMLEIVKLPVSGADWENGEISVTAGDLTGSLEQIIDLQDDVKMLKFDSEEINADIVQSKTDISELQTASHTHENKTAIDSITADDIGIWNDEYDERTQADSLLHSLLIDARIYDYLAAGTWVGSQFVNLPVGTEFVVFNSSYDPLYPNEEVTYTKFFVNDERAYTLSSSIEPNKAYKCKIISQVDVSIDGHNGEIEVIGEFTDSDAYNEINNKLEILSAPVNHRNIFRGKNLGNAVTEEQKTAIQSGTFDDLFVGDYWEIDGVKWRIVDMDYWVNVGLSTLTKHHLVIMPDTAIATGAMYNAGETTNSGYINSLFCTQTKTETTESIIYSAFPGLILEMNIILSSNVENGIIKGYDVSSKSTHELPSEVMLFGSSLVSPPISPADTGGRGIAEKTQLALFRIAPSFTVVSGTGCWLRDIATETDFVGISALGMMESASCYTKKGFRPVFAIG